MPKKKKTTKKTKKSYFDKWAEKGWNVSPDGKREKRTKTKTGTKLVTFKPDKVPK